MLFRFFFRLWGRGSGGGSRFSGTRWLHFLRVRVSGDFGGVRQGGPRGATQMAVCQTDAGRRRVSEQARGNRSLYVLQRLDYGADMMATMTLYTLAARDTMMEPVEWSGLIAVCV